MMMRLLLASALRAPIDISGLMAGLCTHRWKEQRLITILARSLPCDGLQALASSGERDWFDRLASS
jgi:hypothetical protein